MDGLIINYLSAVPLVEGLKREIITPLMSLMLAISFIVFIYGVYEYQSTGESKKMEDGKKHIMWGLIGLFIIVSFAGIMTFVSDTVQSLGS